MAEEFLITPQDVGPVPLTLVPDEPVVVQSPEDEAGWTTPHGLPVGAAPPEPAIVERPTDPAGWTTTDGVEEDGG